MIKTLAIDIGGSGLKAMVLDEVGQSLTERTRVETPQPATPEAVLNLFPALLAPQGEFDRVSVGFPGVIRQASITETAANLNPDWIGFNLAAALEAQFAKPVRVCNDADMQGLGVVSGKGVELVVTLGTGFGSALFLNGHLVPNLELGHHPFRKGETYEQQLGRAALDKVGAEKWNQRLEKAIAILQAIFNCDTLYIGGGNTKKVTLTLPLQVEIVPNISGLLGGIALWKGVV
jgi:polyphosphate glucokinase